MSAKRVTSVMAVVVSALFVIGCNTVPSDNAAAAAGQTTFNAECAGCHVASLLAPDASRITNDMGTVNSSMSDIMLTNEEVMNLQAYLATQ